MTATLTGRLYTLNQLLRTEVHGFSDASGAAYGVCIYLKHIFIDRTVSVSLVTSKSRVSPLKQQTLHD
jgi:hypothetical protein